MPTNTATKATKTAPAPAPAPAPPTAIPARRKLEPHELVQSPTIQSAVALQAWGKFAGQVDLAKLVDDLPTRVEKVQAGDMRPIEAMLFGQAMTLETMFTSLARRATNQEYLQQFQAYLGLALKAQAQCRATLEVLAQIKNPRPVLIAKQANLANGPQQINNGSAPACGDESSDNRPVRTGARAHDGESESAERTIGGAA